MVSKEEELLTTQPLQEEWTPAMEVVEEVWDLLEYKNKYVSNIKFVHITFLSRRTTVLLAIEGLSYLTLEGLDLERPTIFKKSQCSLQSNLHYPQLYMKTAKKKKTA